MPATKITAIALLAMFSQVCLAVPTPEVSFMAGVDTSNWISVQFQGKTITYNPAVFQSSGDSTSTSHNGGLSTLSASCTNDCCGQSSFGGTAAPWAHEGDCAAIRDWAYAQNTRFSVWGATPDYHGIVFAGTCAFGAGTENWYNTYIGSSDIGDLTRDGINQFAVRILKRALGTLLI